LEGVLQRNTSGPFINYITIAPLLSKESNSCRVSFAGGRELESA